MSNQSKQKLSDPDEFPDKFWQTFKKGITPILENLFQRTEAEIIFPNSLYEANITLIPKVDKGII